MTTFPTVLLTNKNEMYLIKDTCYITYNIVVFHLFFTEKYT